MKIALMQRNIVWANPQENRLRTEAALLAAPPSALYVLPEMFSTGFAANPLGVAEADGASLQWMRRMAARLDAAVAGSVAAEVSGRFRNRFYFVEPDGRTSYYDKHHLFSYASEQDCYQAGDRRVVVTFRGVRFLLMVCYDLRFPLWSRCREDYDCILYVASWPASRQKAWDILLRARAIENQCYVCGVNRVGDDPVCHYEGGTQLVHPYGHTLCAAPDGLEGCAVGEIDIEALEAFRKKFPVLKDRDQSLINPNN